MTGTPFAPGAREEETIMGVTRPGRGWASSLCGGAGTAFLLALLLLAPGPSRSADPPAAPGAPARAEGSLVIALLPERNVFEQKKRYQPLQDYLSRQIGRPVYFKLLDNYQVIFSEILDGHVDGAFFGSMNGAIAQLKGGVEILARPIDLNGVSTYSGYLFTTKGSAITADPKTWKGKRIALVNKATTAGYLYPLALFRTSGQRGDPERYFAKLIFTGSHDAAILSVFSGEADLGACKNTVFEEYVRTHPEVGAALVVLGQSSQVPSNGLGVRPKLDEGLKKSIRAALLGMHESTDGQRALRQFQAQRFVATTAQDYQPVFDMAREAGLDLAQWPLRDLH
jgi:phosphonate transport system substrate-binding protein